MALATLSIDLVAQLANLQAGMDKAGRLAEKNAAQIEARYQRVQTALVGIGAALGAAFSVSQLTQFFRTTVDGLDALNDLSDATGASVENLSALEDIALRTGTQMATVGDAVVKLNKALGDAKPGSEIADAFKKLGLNAEELKRVDPAEALRRVAVALSGFASDGDKARVVQELFGKSLKEVAPLLKDLAEAGQLNATVTKEQAEEAERFNKALFAFQKNVLDVAREVSGPMLQALNALGDAFRDSGEYAGELSGTAAKLAVPLQALTVLGANVAFVFRGVGTEIGAIAAQAVALASFDYAAVKAIRALAVQDAKAARAELDAFERRVLNLDGAANDKLRRQENRGFTPGSAPSIGGLSGEKKAGKTGDPDLFGVKLDDTTNAALDRLRNNDPQKIAALRLELQALIELRAERGAGSVDEAILDIEEALAKITPEGQAAAAAVERFKAILAQTPTAQLQAVLADIELINKEFAGTPEKAEQWAEAIMVATAGLRKGTEETGEQISEFAQQAARNIQDALGESVLASMEGSTGKIEDIWKNMLKRLVAQAAAVELGKFLLGDQYGKNAKVGGAVGTFFDYLKSLGGGTRASGGPVTAGRPYLVGERGPELIVPRNNGTVVPNGAMVGGGSGVSMVVNIQGDASENTLRLLEGAFANFEARLMSRRGA